MKLIIKKKKGEIRGKTEEMGNIHSKIGEAHTKLFLRIHF